MSLSNPAIVIGVSAVDTASQALTGVDNKVKQTANTIEAEGNKAALASEKMSSKIRQNLGSIATSVASLGAGIVGFATSFDTLERAQVGADRANLVYQKSLKTLNDLQASGKASARELANAQEAVRINSEKAKLAQDQLGDTYTNFFANVPSQLISFGVAGSSIMTMLRGSTIATSFSMQALGTTMKAVFLSNPITLPLIGVATLITLVATNTFGLRDAFFELGKTIYEFFNKYFKPLADAMKWFYESVLKPIGSFMGGPAVQSADAYSESIGNLGIATSMSADLTRDYADQLAALEQNTKNAAAENANLNAVFSAQNGVLQENTGYVRNLAVATVELADAQKQLDKRQSNVRYETTESDRLPRGAAEARERYGDVDLVRIGGHFKPASLVAAQRNLAGLQGSYDMTRRHFAKGGFTGDELTRLATLKTRVDEARQAYEQEKVNLNVIVNMNKDSAYVEVRDEQNRLLKSSRQILAGAGLT